jgi:hypothetical protein
MKKRDTPAAPQAVDSRGCGVHRLAGVHGGTVLRRGHARRSPARRIAQTLDTQGKSPKGAGLAQAMQ